MSKFKIRRALLNAIAPVLDAESVKHVTNGETLLRKDVSRYVSLSYEWGDDIVREIGPAPRIEKSGSMTCGCFTGTDLGEDQNDVLSALCRSAFPYDAEFVFDGIRVNISTVDDGTMVRDGSFFYSPLTVNWTVWRS